MGPGHLCEGNGIHCRTDNALENCCIDQVVGTEACVCAAMLLGKHTEAKAAILSRQSRGESGLRIRSYANARVLKAHLVRIRDHSGASPCPPEPRPFLALPSLASARTPTRWPLDALACRCKQAALFRSSPQGCQRRTR